MAVHHQRTTCVLCDSADLELVVPLHPCPIGGEMVDRADTYQPCYPIDLHACRACGHVQLIDVIAPEVLFMEGTYASGTTGLVKHFQKLSQAIISTHCLAKDDLVIDIGSNDGAYLEFFHKQGMRTLGVDPSLRLVAMAAERGIKTMPVFFDQEVGRQIRQNYGAAKLVTANNVFAHSENLPNIAQGIRAMLADDGVFVFEVSYLLDVIDHLLLGTIIHEHLSYHTIKPLCSFLDRAGMALISVERVPIQGGSLICTAQPKGGGRAVDAVVAELIAMEEDRGIYGIELYRQFTARIDALGSKIKATIQSVPPGQSIVGFGAARGGTLYLYQFDLANDLSYIIDDDPAKQGRFNPGCHLPIKSSVHFYEDHPALAIILAWVHSEKIIKAHRSYLEAGGAFLTVYPEFRVITQKDL